MLSDSCIDKDLLIEFDAPAPAADGTWSYFDVGSSTDASNSPVMPIDSTDIDAFAKSGRQYFATSGWHNLHCMFTWRRKFRVRLDAVNVEPWNNNEEHIHHYSEYIMQTVRWGLSKDIVETQV